jgi:RNA polymerase sigma factor (sigma-70 family)
MIGGDARELAGDASVIERSVTEPERFALVFDRHGAHIHRYLARRVGQQAADDLVGETFLTAFRKRSRYDTSYPDARPWLYGIATNLVGQHRREELRRYRLAKLVGPDRFGADHADRVLAEVTSQSMRAVLGDALVGLAPGDRDVLLLIAFEELTYEEVARALDIPLGTVRSRLHRARSQLRDALAETEAIGTYEEILSND